MEDDASRMMNLVVWGIHRSGTSLLTQGLERLGWRLGDVERVGTVENPEGYFENRSLRDINRRLLAELGVDWSDWSFDPEAVDFSGPRFDGFRAEAAELLDALTTEAGAVGGGWVLKDPRMSALAGFWVPLLDAAAEPPAALLILRDPHEVAASQMARSMQDPQAYPGLTCPEAMIAIWLRQTRACLRRLADRPILVVRHADLGTDAAASFARVLAFAGNPNGEIGRIEGLFKPHYFRSRPLGGRVSGTWSPLAERLFRALADRADPLLLPTQTAAILEAAPALRGAADAG